MRRSPGEEAAWLGAAAGRREGTVGEEPAAGAAAVPAHGPRQGGRYGGFKPGGEVLENSRSSLSCFRSPPSVTVEMRVLELLTVLFPVFTDAEEVS